MKKIYKFRFTALFICVIILLPLISACGEKPADTGSNATAAVSEDTTTADTITEATTTTEEPTTPEPTTTEEPTTWEPIDPSLPYWEQIQIELSRYGLTGGEKILNGVDEAEVMKKFSPNNGKRAELDVSGDNVPFSVAYSVNISKDMTNFWDASYTASLMKDVAVEQDDLIVGVVWIRGKRVAESDQFMADDAPQYYLALKTATDNWATEGDMNPQGAQEAQETWQKVFFAGRIMNEETQSSTVQFQIFLGYGIEEIDFGGIIAYRFPSTTENEKAVIKLVY